MTDLARAVDAARAFVDAVAWGEHHRVWELLGTEGRKAVVRVAMSRGMDEPLAGRLREDRATDHEREEFLTDLVNGLRADLSGNDLDCLEYRLDDPDPSPGNARVVLTAPLPTALAADGLPVGTLELSDGPTGWRIERLVPHSAR